MYVSGEKIYRPLHLLEIKHPVIQRTSILIEFHIYSRFRCSADETLEMIPTDDRRIQKFSLEAFAFVGDHPFVYMHCLVKVCRASNPNSRCAKGCIRGRGKRSAMVEDSTDDEAYLVQGPFELEQEPKKQDDETQIEKTIKEDQALEKSGKLLINAAFRYL